MVKEESLIRLRLQEVSPQNATSVVIYTADKQNLLYIKEDTPAMPAALWRNGYDVITDDSVWKTPLGEFFFYITW